VITTKLDGTRTMDYHLLNISDIRGQTPFQIRGKGGKMKFEKISNLFIILVLTTFFSLGMNDIQAAKGGLAGTGDIHFNPAGDSEHNICLGGVNEDVNLLLGVNEQVVWDGCPQVNSGEFYVLLSGFLTNAPNLKRCCFAPCDPEAIPNCDPSDCNPDGSPDNPENLCYEYPSDYDPNGLSPAEDLISKIPTVTFVVDQKKVYPYQSENIAKILDTPAFPGIPPQWQLIEWPAKLPPLRPGSHTVEIHHMVTDFFCDGTCLDVGICCLEPGDYNFYTWNFEVLPGASQSER